MPGKKKGTKKRKKPVQKSVRASDGEDKVERLDAGPDFHTMMSTPQTEDDGKKGKKGKKKKKRKVKMSKSERARAKLEKEIAKLRDNDVFFDSFIDRMHKWLLDRADLAIELYRKMDIDGEGAVTVEEFKAGLFDLNVPLTKVEVHLFTRLLDPEDTGEIDYTQFKLGLQLARHTFDLEKEQEFESITLITTQRKFPPCPCCKMSVIEPYKELNPRYLNLNLRMVTFEKFHNYPGHLEFLVHDHLPVFGLIQMILQETQITSSKLAIFSDASRSRESLLSPKFTLAECGVKGDSRTEPAKVTLYYDYTVEFTDCPILLCDHYFGQKLRVE